MRKFRAIVQSLREPQDHEVIWQYNGKMLYWNNGWLPFTEVMASDITYKYEEAEGVENLAQALDKLFYVVPKITNFTLRLSGIYENGDTIYVQDFIWSYNKKSIKSLTLNGIEIPPKYRSFRTKKEITTNTTFNLWASDGTNEVRTSASIEFKNYLYYGLIKDHKEIKRLKVNPSIDSISITAGEDEYIWIFIPKTAEYTKIWYNNVDSTNDFIYDLRSFRTDYGLNIIGTFYISKNPNLNTVTLKFT